MDEDVVSLIETEMCHELGVKHWSVSSFLDYDRTLTTFGLGNFHRSDAASFLRSFSDVLQPSDTFLLGLDSCTNPSKV